MLKSIRVMLLLSNAVLIFPATPTSAQNIPSDYEEVLKTLDKKGDFKDRVLKVNIPRNDLKIAIQGFPTPTPFGFGGWIAFTKTANGSEVMRPILPSALRRIGFDRSRNAGRCGTG